MFALGKVRFSLVSAGSLRLYAFLQRKVHMEGHIKQKAKTSLINQLEGFTPVRVAGVLSCYVNIVFGY